MSARANMVEVAAADYIPVGASTSFKVGDRSIAVFNFEGTFFALDNHCPHQGASIAGAEILPGGKIRCMLHGWPFKLGGCQEEDDLRRYPVLVEDGKLLVGTDPLPSDKAA